MSREDTRDPAGSLFPPFKPKRSQTTRRRVCGSSKLPNSGEWKEVMMALEWGMGRREGEGRSFSAQSTTGQVGRECKLETECVR